MKNLRMSSVLVSGMGSVGVEIAKNLILGGVRSVTIHDTKNCEWNDLSAQVFVFRRSRGFFPGGNGYHLIDGVI
ncbi:unnamed protein product [Toxocara canis]|uniref:ThiF domain-containing protein n=1 Tax=Toxocara canis TaxID=6265 RepID=A0A183VAU9_TOXCA|nr:unnamed protein product [Toxocara canis]